MLLGIPVPIWDDVTGSFYGNNGVCLPLYLDEPFLHGWWYSSLLFFGVYFASLAITVFCVVKTKLFVANLSELENSSEVRADLTVSRRFWIMMTVNLIGWLPLILIKILAFTSFDIISELTTENTSVYSQ